MRNWNHALKAGLLGFAAGLGIGLVIAIWYGTIVEYHTWSQVLQEARWAGKLEQVHPGGN
jgi:hypothetical protein